MIIILFFWIDVYVAQTQCQQSYMNLQPLDYQFYSTKFLLDGDVTLSYWFKYQKKVTIPTQFISSTDVKASTISIGQLLFRLFDSKLYRLYSYIQDEKLKTVIIGTKNKITQEDIMDASYFEGVWQLKLYTFQNNLITHELYNYVTKIIVSQSTQFIIDPTNINEGSVGGYGHLQDFYQDLYFSSFQGRITQLNLYKGTPTINDQCIINTCQLTEQTLIEGIVTTTGNIYTTTLIMDSKFKWQGWFRIPIIVQTTSIIQLRQAVSSEFQNTLLNLKIVSSTQLALSARTYEDPLNTDDLLIDIVTPQQWFFVVFIYNREKKDQTGLDIYNNNQEISLRYNDLILFYSGVNLYFYVNGSQITKLSAESCFSDYQFVLGCDVTCLTCNGPTINHCLTCNGSDNRNLTDDKECKCKDGYFQFAGQKKCQELSQLNFFELTESQSQIQNCKFGEFLVDTQCYSCPKSEGNAILYCGDCLNNQNTWQYDLKCRYNYQLSDQNEPLSVYLISQHDTELYLLNRNAQSIIDCVGCLELCEDDDCKQVYGINLRCKIDYYYKDGQCIQCDPNCKQCSLSLCLQCLDGYYFDSILQLCVQYQETTDCGFKCLQCSKQCYYCEDGYKISNDGVNCELYEIEQCKNEVNIQQITNTYNFAYNVLTQSICTHCSTNNYNFDDQTCKTITQTCSYSITIQSQNTCLDNVLQSTCNTISNCLQCLKDNGDYQVGYCVQCEKGYYVDLSYGRCLKCPDGCTDCITDTADTNRIHIQQLLYFQLGILKQYQQTHIFQLPIRCLSCNGDLELINKTCVDSCPSYCSDCQIIDNKNVCTECLKSQVYSDSECIECPSFCSACSSRTQLEIAKLNPLFDANNTAFTKFSNKCYKPKVPKPFLSNKFQTVLQCKTFDQCTKILKLQINLYCTNNIPTGEIIQINNFYLGDFADSFQTQFYNEQFLQQLNELLVQQLDISFVFQDDCIFDKIEMDQSFQKYIFTLESVNLKFYSKSMATLPNSFIFRNYTSIEFENIQFLENTLIDMSSYFTNFKLAITNCQTKIQNGVFNFKANTIQEFTINNFQISESTISNTIFSMPVQQLSITGLTIDQSTFVNMTIFQISSNQQFSLINTAITNCSFTNSKMLYLQQIGDSMIDHLKVIDNKLNGTGYLITVTALTSLIKNVDVKYNTFYNYTSFIKVQGVDMQTFNVIGNNFQWGGIFQGSEFNIVNYTIKAITVQSNWYTNTLFSLKNCDLLILNNFLMLKNIPNQEAIKQYNYYTNSLFSFIGIRCQALNINITTGLGIVTLYFSFNQLDIENIQLQQDQNIILQPSEICLKSLYKTDFYTTMLRIVGSQIINLNYLQVSNAQIIDDCLICIEDFYGYNKQQVTIKNSLFQQNKVITTKDVYASLLFVQSTNSLSFLDISYTQASENVLFQYTSDGKIAIGTIMVVIYQYGTVLLSNNQFTNNHALNTTNSILYLQADQLIVQSCQFMQNNNEDLTLIFDKISNSFPQTVYLEQIRDVFSINSYGGNGQYVSSNLSIIDCKFEQSFSQIAAGLFIQTMNSGFVLIQSCTFVQLHCSLTTESYGGAIVIDGSTANIQATINSCSFDDVMVKMKGGILFVKTSEQTNYITMNKLIINNAIALMGSFVYIDFPDTDYSILNIQEIDWTIDQTQVQSYFGKLQYLKQEYKQQLKSFAKIITITGGRTKLDSFYIMSNYYFGCFSGSEFKAILINNVIMSQTQSLLFNAFFIGQSPQNVNSFVIINKILFDTINTNAFNSYTFCTNPIAIDILQVNVICSDQSITRRDFVSALNQINDNADCNQNLLQTYSYKDGWSWMDILHIQTLDSISLNQLIQLNNIALLSSTIDMFESVLDASNSNIGPTANKSLQLSHIMTIQTSGGSFAKINSNSPENQRLLQTTNSVYSQIYFEHLLSHLNSFATQSLGSISQFNFIFQDIIITNVTQYTGSMADLMGYGIQFYFFNILITDNTIQTTQYSNPIRVVTVDYFVDLIKTNFIILFNTRPDGTLITNFALRSGQGLGFSVNSITNFKKVIKYQDEKKQIEEVYIKPYYPAGQKNITKYLTLPSGQTISNYSYFDQVSEVFYPLSYNLSLSLQNSQQENLVPQTGYVLNYTFQWRIMNESNPIESTPFTYLYSKVTTDSKNPIFINDLIIDFDPYASPELFYQLSIISTRGIYISNYDENYPFSIVGKKANYELRVNIKTFQCQVGEYIYLNQCRQCDATQNYFQVLSGQTFCFFKDDASTISVKSYSVQMKPSYWRYRFNSTKIEYCYHQPESCLGGWKYSDQTCILGHIGALCEQCDLYNLRGEGSFSVSSQYNCGTCTDVKWNIIIIIIIAFFTLILGAITVKSNVDDTAEFILRTKMGGAFGIAPSVRIMSTILLKLLTNYAQIISSIFTFQLELPPQIQQSTNSVGNPTQSMVYSLDCFLKDLSSLTIMYLEFIWMVATPFFFISTIFVFFFSFVLLKLAQFNIGVITTTLIYFYVYMQPNLIQNMISQLSKRQISEIYFVQGNVSYLYYSETHQQWLYFVIVPILFIIGLVIPFSLWYQVFKNRNSLEDIKVRRPWGYLYNEYKKDAFYWETIKLIQKQTIIIALNYYEDQVSIKASLVLLIVFLYHVLSNKFNPYYVFKLNRLDTMCTIVCSISIILCSTIYNAQVGGQTEIVWPFYIVTALVNAFYILDLVIQIVFSYLAQYQDLFDKVKTFISRSCPYFVDRYPYIKSFLITKQQRQKIIKERWSVIKDYLFRKAKRTVRARKLTVIQSPESYYQRRNGISSPSPLVSYRDNIKGDMIDSLSQMNSSLHRKQNQSNPTIKLVETVYHKNSEKLGLDKQDEYQVIDDPLSPQVVYISINPKTRSQLVQQ